MKQISPALANLQSKTTTKDSTALLRDFVEVVAIYNLKSRIVESSFV
ncbi:hypothetical protein [Helicobacter sp. MIT 05-5294]|nr:hypothetical protein [Helicobacter sp. MIT 05-5294]